MIAFGQLKIDKGQKLPLITKPGKSNTLFIRPGQKITYLPTQALIPCTWEDQYVLRQVAQAVTSRGNVPPTNPKNGCKDAKLTFANMPPSVLNGGVAVNIREQPQAKPVLIVWRVSEAIHQDAGGRSMERLPNTIIQLIVDNGAPMLWLFIGNSLNICKATTEMLQSNGAGIEAWDVQIHKPADFGQRSLKDEPDNPLRLNKGSSVFSYVWTFHSHRHTQ